MFLGAQLLCGAWWEQLQVYELSSVSVTGRSSAGGSISHKPGFCQPRLVLQRPHAWAVRGGLAREQAVHSPEQGASCKWHSQVSDPRCSTCSISSLWSPAPTSWDRQHLPAPDVL